MSGCANCRAHGRIENDVVILPCTSCAQENGWTWRGFPMYGVNGYSGGRQSTIQQLVAVYFDIVRPRLIEFGDSDPDGYILDILPDEGKDIYKSMVRPPTWAEIVARSSNQT